MHNEANGIKPDFSRYLSTEELAKILKITPQGIRKRLCVTGSFHGVKPLRTGDEPLHVALQHGRTADGRLTGAAS